MLPLQLRKKQARPGRRAHRGTHLGAYLGAQRFFAVFLSMQISAGALAFAGFGGVAASAANSSPLGNAPKDAPKGGVVSNKPAASKGSSNLSQPLSKAGKAARPSASTTAKASPPVDPNVIAPPSPAPETPGNSRFPPLAPALPRQYVPPGVQQDHLQQPYSATQQPYREQPPAIKPPSPLQASEAPPWQPTGGWSAAGAPQITPIAPPAAASHTGPFRLNVPKEPPIPAPAPVLPAASPPTKPPSSTKPAAQAGSHHSMNSNAAANRTNAPNERVRINRAQESGPPPNPATGTQKIVPSAGAQTTPPAPKIPPSAPSKTKKPAATTPGLLKPLDAQLDTGPPSPPPMGDDKPGSTIPAPGSTTSASESTIPAPGSTTSPPGASPPRSTVPPGAPGSASQGTTDDAYPTIGHMERLVFGEAQTALSVDQRLSKLEDELFRQNYSSQSLFDRTERLKATIFGSDSSARADGGDQGGGKPAPSTQRAQQEYGYFDQIANHPRNKVVISQEQFEQFALDLVNSARANMRLAPLAADALAIKLARQHSSELAKHNVVSHMDQKGDNPDRRYTLEGGTDAIMENLVAIKNPEGHPGKLTGADVARILKVMMTRQDDRDALMSFDATHFGFGAHWTGDHSKLIACAEVVTKRGIIHPIPHEVRVGDRVELKGVILQPYHFDRVTIAWEGVSPSGPGVDDSDEALPYFPPLDYIAYAIKSDRDMSKAVGALKAVGIVAAIAGGMFMPPVALAAPLIAVSGPGPAEHKPASEIPIKGGMKVEGSVFSGKLPISNDGKDGLYYITVWANTAQGGKSIPISRRVIMAKGDAVSVDDGNGKESGKEDKKSPKESKSQSGKHSHNKQSDSKQSDSKQSDSKQSDNKQSDSKQSDSKQSDSKQSDSKQSDNKQSDSKQSDNKQSDSKQSDKQLTSDPSNDGSNDKSARKKDKKKKKAT